MSKIQDLWSVTFDQISVAALYAKKKERGRVILLPPLVSDYEIKLRQWD